MIPGGVLSETNVRNSRQPARSQTHPLGGRGGVINFFGHRSTSMSLATLPQHKTKSSIQADITLKCWSSTQYQTLILWHMFGHRFKICVFRCLKPTQIKCQCGRFQNQSLVGQGSFQRYWPIIQKVIQKLFGGPDKVN